MKSRNALLYLAVSGLGLLSFSSSATAQLFSNKANSSFVDFSPTTKLKQKVRYNPPNVGAPRTSSGGVVRGNCEDQNCLIALQPGSRFELDKLPLTVSDYPVFFFNIANTINERGYFQLYEVDESTNTENLVYQTKFPVNSRPGIIKFRLPQNISPLKVNSTYRWVFSIGEGTSAQTVKSFFKRINLDSTLAAKLQSASPLKQASIYAEEGIWFETLERLADTHFQQPYNFVAWQAWIELLNSVNLAKIAKQPLLDCCKSTTY